MHRARARHAAAGGGERPVVDAAARVGRPGERRQPQLLEQIVLVPRGACRRVERRLDARQRLRRDDLVLAARALLVLVQVVAVFLVAAKAVAFFDVGQRLAVGLVEEARRALGVLVGAVLCKIDRAVPMGGFIWGLV